MRSLCLDEGILQSYYDGELSTEMLDAVLSHLASCRSCSEAALKVESEMELATAAFSAEMSLEIPTERLRLRVEKAIAASDSRAGLGTEGVTERVRAWFSSLSSPFTFPSHRAMGFASLVIFFVLAAVIGGVVMQQRDTQSSLIAVSENNNEQGDVIFVGPSHEATVIRDASPVIKRRKPTIRVTSSALPEEPIQNGTLAQSKLLPGEKNYLQAISLLTEAIEVNGESSLKPTLLADYKRNLAVVEQAISATQRTARTNPQSADAVEMLYVAYQSKLDLLSAVAEQTRPLIAER